MKLVAAKSAPVGEGAKQPQRVSSADAAAYSLDVGVSSPMRLTHSASGPTVGMSDPEGRSQTPPVSGGVDSSSPGCADGVDGAPDGCLLYTSDAADE